MSRLSLVALLAMVLPGCPPDATEFFFDETFEETCSGTPCGWVVAAGPTGSVVWVETLPGEHGIALYGDRVAVLGPTDGEESPSGLSAESLVAYLAARCDADASLEVEVTVQDLTTGRLGAFRGMVLPGATWDGGVSTISLRPVTGGTGGIFFRDMVALRILKEGPGVCEVDEIGLAQADGLRF